MAVFETVYEWDDAEAQAWFDYAGYKTRRASEPLREAGNAILDSVAEAFATEGASIGYPWRDLSEKYKPVKVHRYGHIYPILVGDGTLEHAATSQRAIHTRSSTEGGLLEYVVRVPYAVYHQSEEPRYRIPRRPFFELTHELVERIEDAFVDWLDDLRTHNARRGGDSMLNPFTGLL